MSFSLGVNITLDPKRAAVDCALAKSLGAHWVRTSQEPPWGSVDDRLGPFRKACDDNGLLLMQVIQPAGHRQPRTQADLDAWGEVGAENAVMADAMSGGNEVNGYGSNELPDPAAAATAFLAVVEARDKLARGRRLMTPSMCPASGPIGSGYVEPLLFLEKMFAAQPALLQSAKTWIDWHGYCDGRYDPSTAETWNMCWRTRALAADLVTLGSRDLHISWSEFGTATGPSGFSARVSEAVQALRLQQQLNEARSQRKAGVEFGPLIVYRLRDSTPADLSDWPSQAGLVRVDGSTKPAGQVFQSLAAAA